MRPAYTRSAISVFNIGRMTEKSSVGEAPPGVAPAAQLARLRARVRDAAEAAGRDPDAIRILAVSKRQPIDAIEALAEAGLTDFGENYLQEALPKISQLSRLTWHFIGAVQGNKTRAIAEHFSWVHTIDRERIARRLAEQRPAELPPLDVCIEVNLSAEPTKSGVAPTQVAALAAQIAGVAQLRLRGLMALPAPADDYATQLATFQRLAEIQADLQAKGHALDTLSMGTSSDFTAAIAAGATIIRIGTALFGPRGAR